MIIDYWDHPLDRLPARECTDGVDRDEDLPASSGMRTTEIQPGRETDARVAEVVFGASWPPVGDSVTYEDGTTDWGPPPFSEVDGAAWLYLWPKIVEKTGPGVALIWARDKDADTVGDDPTPGFRLVTGGNYWSAFEIDTHDGLDIDAPTLALCLTRAALALYGEKP